jgi:integrase/recombinase XerD
MTTSTTTRRPGRPANKSGGQAPALTAEQVKVLLRVTADDKTNAARNVALLSLLLCGCRVSEPLTLTRGQVITGGKVAESFVLGAANTKSKKARRVYLSPSARKNLGAWLEEMPSHDDNELIFPLTANYATTLVASLMKQAGIKGSSHSLRRSCATTLAEAGVAVHTISELLGHSSVAVTSVYLARNTANVQRAVANNLPW